MSITIAAPLCPRLAAAHQIAARIVVSLVLGLLPRRSSPRPIDLLFFNLVAVGEKTGQAIPVALLHGNDPQVCLRASLAIEAAILRSMSADVALWLLTGGSKEPADRIPEELLPDGDVVELTAALLLHWGQDPDDPYVLGQGALERWNVLLAILTEDKVWALVTEVVKILLRHEKITTDQLDEAVEGVEGAASLLDDYQTVIGEVLEEWHGPKPGAPQASTAAS